MRVNGLYLLLCRQYRDVGVTPDLRAAKAFYDNVCSGKQMRIVINFKEDGSFEVATDEPCEVYTVCDFTPNDRVYRLTETHMVSRAAVDAALRDDPVGHSSDERHAAVKNRILSAEDGKPYLRPVE